MAQQSISGLRAVKTDRPIPLKDVRVEARVNGYVASVSSSLRYENSGESPLEVAFAFPVPASWAVVGLEATIGASTIRGVVREKEEARQKYDDAIASGFSAAIAEEKAGDIFSITLGNLPPQETAEIRLELVGELPVDAEGGARFSLPSVLKPRYTPAGATDPLAQAGAETSAVGEGEQIDRAYSPAVFSFSLRVLESVGKEGEGGVASVESPTHAITSERRQEKGEGELWVTLQDQEGPLDKDLVILVCYPQPHQPKAICEAGETKEEGEGEGDKVKEEARGGENRKTFMSSPVVMLNFVPKCDIQQHCEFIFLVDRSGSMQGAFIESVRDTLTLFLKSLPPDCLFNIVGFGSSHTSLFPKSVPYNQDNLNTAVAHAESLEANLGGTELLRPLTDIFSKSAPKGVARQVFLLTDGSVSNTSQCIACVQSNATKARCFTFGIGSGASTALVEGLAKAGNGTAEFIQHGERFQPKVIRTLKRAMQPPSTHISITHQLPSNITVQWASETPPSVFSGDKVIMYGVLKGCNSSTPSTISGSFTLEYTIGETKFEHFIDVRTIPTSRNKAEGVSISTLHHLAAKSLIQDWQTKLSPAPNKELEQKIVRLSIESSVVSSYTAYVAVQEQGEPVEGAMKMWDIKALSADHGIRRKMVALGYSGQERFRSLSSTTSMQYRYASISLSDQSTNFYASAPRQSSACCTGGGGGGGRDHSHSSRPSPSRSTTEKSNKIASSSVPTQKPTPQPASTPSPRGMQGLISLQLAGGEWLLNEALAAELSKPLHELQSACPDSCQGKMEEVWGTMLVLMFLEMVNSAQKEEWELVAIKAENFLKQFTDIDIQQAKDTARKIMKS